MRNSNCPDITSKKYRISGQLFSIGFTEDYQTLDVLASVIFAEINIAASNAKGYHNITNKMQVLFTADAVSSIFPLTGLACKKIY